MEPMPRKRVSPRHQQEDDATRKAKRLADVLGTAVFATIPRVARD